jgi:BirA family biotin operon repressor/biotin-[acetyl-CoA-carboxylase] ligase
VSPAAVQWRLETHDRLASTSDICRARALAGEPEGLAVRASVQTAGRGTQGRHWVSPAGNLYLSVLLRPDVAAREAGQFALLAGVAVAESLQPHTPQPLALKWPNDVLRDGGKLAGVLVETASSGAVLDWLVIGIGANLAVAPALADRPTASLGGRVTPQVAADAVLARLGQWETIRRREGFAPVREAWIRLGGALLGADGHPLAA